MKKSGRKVNRSKEASSEKASMMAELPGKSLRRSYMGVHTEENLDEEWIKLMKEAKDLGIKISEIKAFLKNEGV